MLQRNIFTSLLGGLVLVSVAFLGGCIDSGNDSSSTDNPTVFASAAADYGKTLVSMKEALSEHYNSFSDNGMMGMMSMMMQYRDTMNVYMSQLNTDLQDMIDYCTNLGMHDDDFWDDMMDTHEQCLDEIGMHYGDMSEMMDHMDSMDDMMDEMDEHMHDMTDYFTKMEGYHQWMLDHDSQDH